MNILFIWTVPDPVYYDLCHNHCGEHGTCVQHLSVTGDEYWNCKCDYGWQGQYCEISKCNTLQ